MPMNDQPHTTSILIEEELQQTLLDYSMSVIVSRALPDVRDGQKCGNRRILYTFYELGFFYNKPYHKSVRIVGEVLGKYHPHGDQAVYNTMVGMVQPFSKRYPLLDGQGNWGSTDGDNAAAMRYTEVRMQRIAQEILYDIDKGTVPFVPNFDGSTIEPSVLPSRLPLLLINGSTGIAVGMATSVPPHNLKETIDACLAYLHNDQITDEELLQLIPAPDFPTGGVICGRSGIIKAYTTGRGNLILRGIVEIEEVKKGHVLLVITELPYQVIKSDLVAKIASLVREKIIEGVVNIRDESDRHGMRVVLELRRDENPQVVINQLYKFTNLQVSIGILLLGLIDKQPLVFTLRQLIHEFLAHRENIIYKRSEFDLNKALTRESLLIGFSIVLKDIDAAITAIKGSKDAEDALKQLSKRFMLTNDQAKAVLEMRLQRLTSLEQDKIFNELKEVQLAITGLKKILQDRSILRQEIVKELTFLRQEYGDDRRTRIEESLDIFQEQDLIPDEEAIVTLTRKGYIKRVPLETYGVQHRGGKGKMGMADLDNSEDIIEDIFAAKTHDELLFFTNLGRVYGMHVFEIPEASRMAKGRAIINILPLAEGEQVVKLLCARQLEGKFLIMVTSAGTIKRTDATSFIKIRKTGIRAITLHENDQLVFCALSNGSSSIVLATRNGKGIHFLETEVREMGRQAAGVIGIRMASSDAVVGMQVVDENKDILFATQHGYGKRVKVKEFRLAHRGGQGVRTIPTDKRNGLVIGLIVVDDSSHVLLIDDAGKIIRLSSQEIRTMGRQAKGVRLIRLDEDQILNAMVAFSSIIDNTEIVDIGTTVQDDKLEK